MNTKKFWKFAKIALCLLLAFTMPVLAACQNGNREEIKDPILEAENGALPLSFYEFLLSRMKGTLARNKYDVKDPDFWATETADGRTYEEYYNQSILESCKNYLAASLLFEKEGLKLPDSVLASIEEEISFYIDYDGGKDEEKFNKLIEKYGVDADSLKQAYILEAEYEYLIAYLYGGGDQIGDALKEEHYQEHYLRFKQILLPKFYYEYERDETGNLIYFDPETGKPLYDTENGTYVYDETGNRVRDEFGVTIYYDKNGTPVYNTEKGKPSVVLDESGEGVRYEYSAEELKKQAETADELLETLKEGNYAAFEAEQTKHVNILGSEDSYPDGFYLSDLALSGYDDYMTDIYRSLKSMEPGEIALVETEYGYHVIMKYELDAGKYKDGAYAEWFSGFEDSIINELFLQRVKETVGEIKINEENLAKARSIKKIGTNYDY